MFPKDAQAAMAALAPGPEHTEKDEHNTNRDPTRRTRDVTRIGYLRPTGTGWPQPSFVRRDPARVRRRPQGALLSSARMFR